MHELVCFLCILTSVSFYFRFIFNQWNYIYLRQDLRYVTKPTGSDDVHKTSEADDVKWED